MSTLVRCNTCGFTCIEEMAAPVFITVVMPPEQEGVLNFCSRSCLLRAAEQLLATGPTPAPPFPSPVAPHAEPPPPDPRLIRKVSPP